MKKKVFVSGMVILSIFTILGCQQKTASPSANSSTTSIPAVNPNVSSSQNDFLGVIMRMNKMMTIGKNHVTSPMEDDLTMANGLKVARDGKLTFPAGKTIPKNDYTKNLDRSLTTEDLVAMDGTIMWNNSMVTLPSGVTVQAGTVFLNDGTQVLNAVSLPDGTSIFDNAEAIVNGKTVSFEGQAGALKDGTKVSFDGKLVTVTRPDGTVIVVGKSTKLPDGTMIDYDTGVITRADGVTFDPETGLKLKDGTIVAGSNTITLK